MSIQSVTLNGRHRESRLKMRSYHGQTILKVYRREWDAEAGRFAPWYKVVGYEYGGKFYTKLLPAARAAVAASEEKS